MKDEQEIQRAIIALCVFIWLVMIITAKITMNDAEKLYYKQNRDSGITDAYSAR